MSMAQTTFAKAELKLTNLVGHNGDKELKSSTRLTGLSEVQTDERLTALRDAIAPLIEGQVQQTTLTIVKTLTD